MICECAFRNCRSLKELTFEKDSELHTIKHSAFQYSRLGFFRAPEQLRTIEQAAFADCENLEVVGLNKGIESIGPASVAREELDLKGVFENSAVQTITVPATVMKIQRRAFKDCYALRTITLP